MYICIYTHVCVYIYIYIHTAIYTHTYNTIMCARSGRPPPPLREPPRRRPETADWRHRMSREEKTEGG